LKALAEQRCFVFNRIRQLLFKNKFKRGKRRCTADGMATEGRNMSKHGIVADYIHHLPTGDEGTQRHPSTQGLRQQQNIGFYTKVFKSEKLSGSSHTRLNFIQNKEGSRLITAFADRSDPIQVGHLYTRLSLDRLQKQTCGLLRYPGDIVKIIELNKGYPGEERSVSLVKGIVANQTQRALRTSMVGFLCSKNFLSARKTLCKFHSAFRCFGA